MLDFYLIEGGTPADTYLKIARRFNQLGDYWSAYDFFRDASLEKIKMNDWSGATKIDLEMAQNIAKAAEEAKQRKASSKDQIQATVKLLGELKMLGTSLQDADRTYESRYNDFLSRLKSCGNLNQSATMYRMAFKTIEGDGSYPRDAAIDTSSDYIEYAQKVLETSKETLKCLEVGGEVPGKNKDDILDSMLDFISEAENALVKSKKK